NRRGTVVEALLLVSKHPGGLKIGDMVLSNDDVALILAEVAFFGDDVTFKLHEHHFMDVSPSSNHVFDFPADDPLSDVEEDPQEEHEEKFKEDPQEEPKEKFKEDPEEDPKKEVEAEAEEDAPLAATSLVGSPITPPPLSESSSNTKAIALAATNGNVNCLERIKEKHKSEIDTNTVETRKMRKRMDRSDRDLGDEIQFTCGVEGRVCKLEDKEKEKTDEMERMKKRLETLETNYDLVLRDSDRLERALYNLEPQSPKPHGPPDGPQ
ncbi:hypothetical protein Tco_1497249, partial [Tanacetum coccineum]